MDTQENVAQYLLYMMQEKKGKIKRDDLIILCGIGAGYTSAAMLYKVGKEDLNIYENL